MPLVGTKAGRLCEESRLHHAAGSDREAKHDVTSLQGCNKATSNPVEPFGLRPQHSIGIWKEGRELDEGQAL
jgi:hypothetical protein